MYFRRILRPNTFLNRKSALHSRILYESTKVMHRPRSYPPLQYFDIGGTHLFKYFLVTFQMSFHMWKIHHISHITACVQNVSSGCMIVFENLNCCRKEPLPTQWQTTIIKAEFYKLRSSKQNSFPPFGYSFYAV